MFESEGAGGGNTPVAYYRPLREGNYVDYKLVWRIGIRSFKSVPMKETGCVKGSSRREPVVSEYPLTGSNPLKQKAGNRRQPVILEN